MAVSSALPILEWWQFLPGLRENIILHEKRYVAAYCLLGLLLNFMVFRAGFRAIGPKEKAREKLAQLDTMASALRSLG